MLWKLRTTINDIFGYILKLPYFSSYDISLYLNNLSYTVVHFKAMIKQN